jgi:energy-coupling factor transport system permease protein
MVQARVPYRVAHVMYIALRFIPLLQIDVQAIHDAQRLRGVKPGLGKVVKTAVALLATELRRADETAVALETRAFGLYKQRNSLEQVAISGSGIFLVVVTTVLVIGHLTCLWWLR